MTKDSTHGEPLPLRFLYRSVVNIAEAEARDTLKTHDGALIYVVNRGLRHGPQDVMALVLPPEERRAIHTCTISV